MRVQRKEIKEVKYFNVKSFCDCGGELEATGLIFASSPPKYLHKCNGCGKEVTLAETYPRVDRVINC